MTFKSLSSSDNAQTDYAQQMKNIQMKSQQDMLEKMKTDFTNYLTNAVADASSKESTAASQSKLQF